MSAQVANTLKVVSPLLAPLQLGQSQLSHRVAMAAMTRLRNDPVTWGPGDHSVEYYSQRASKGGFILAEASAVMPSGKGYVRGPSLYDDAQYPGWKRVTDAVHAKGGIIYAQAFHAGRVSHPSLAEGGVVGASDIGMTGQLYIPGGAKESYGKPRALSTKEVQDVVDAFALSASKSITQGGFDGVGIHAGNGYLLQQFMALNTNNRTDKYGGSLLNRMRLLLEVVDAMVDKVGSGRVAIKLQPGATFSELNEDMEDVYAQLDFLGPELTKRDLAFVELSSFNHLPYCQFLGFQEPRCDAAKDIWGRFRRGYKGVVMANGGLALEQAAHLVKEGLCDGATFGVPFIANANLPDLVKAGYGTANLNQGGWDMGTWFSKDPAHDAKGYTDWPLVDPATPPAPPAEHKQ